MFFFFFNDIMVYRKALSDHLGHFRLDLESLVKHQLFAKKSKCMFACGEVEYLSHLISGEGVRTNLKKTTAMQQCPVLRDVKTLRGFLGLARYYKKFVKGYEQIAASLTDLLKKDSFVWTVEAANAFQKLKEAISNPPVLALPDFAKPFTMECDSSGVGLGLS